MYTVDYFIEKFKTIPEAGYSPHIDDHRKKNCHCYMGWCELGEHVALMKLLMKLKISAGELAFNRVAIYIHLSLKGRILAALDDIKKLQTKDIDTGGKVKEIIRYVAVPETISKQAKELIQN